MENIGEDEIQEFLEKLTARLNAGRVFCLEDISELSVKVGELYNAKANISEKAVAILPTKIMPYVKGLKEQTEMVQTFLRCSLKQAFENKLFCKTASGQWRSSVKIQIFSCVKYDEYAMAPFHGVEAAMENFNEEIDTKVQEILNMMEALNTDFISMEAKYDNLLREIHNLEPYEEEIKNAVNMQQAILLGLQDDTQLKVRNLERLNAELEAEIAQLGE